MKPEDVITDFKECCKDKHNWQDIVREPDQTNTKWLTTQWCDVCGAIRKIEDLGYKQDIIVYPFIPKLVQFTHNPDLEGYDL